MEQQLETALRNAAAEKTAPVLPMQYINPQMMAIQLRLQREGFDSNLKTKDQTLQMRQTFVGNAPKFSSTPLNKLKRVSAKDMKIRQYHQGQYFLCRTIAPPARMVGILLAVEDPNGWAQALAIYNFPGTFSASGKELDTMFPLHTILAIREPWAKMTLTGNQPQIRIDSPSDIIILHPTDPILSEINWVNGERKSRYATASAAEWKSVGDNHFREAQYFAAAVAYSNALDKDPSSTAIRLNRCFAHIRLSNFVFALHDAQIVLKTPDLQSTDRLKALHRAALAEYCAGRYEAAEGYYKECLSIDAGLKEAITGIEKCHIRIHEREKGAYDWVQLLHQRKVSCARPDVADYIGPVKVAPMKHRGGGRGIVATSDIKPGELLFVYKPFAVSFPKEFERHGSLLAINFLTNKMEMGTQYDVIQQTVAKITASDHLSTPLLDLYAGADPAGEAIGASSASLEEFDSIGNPMKFMADIDIGRIEAIISFNSFGFGEPSMTVGLTEVSPTKEEGLFDSISALYTYPSFINHSCIGNATRETFGHVMVIRAVQNIPKGDEITMSYCGSEVSYPDRTSAIAKYFNECDCSLCVSDRAAGKRFHDTLSKLKDQKYDSPSLKQLRDLVNKLDSLYPPSYPAYRPASFNAHHDLSYQLQLALVNATDATSRDRFGREAIQHEIIALEALGFQVTDKETKEARPADKKKIKLPVVLNRSPYNSGTVCKVCWGIVTCFLRIGNNWRAEMWLRAAIWFEDKALGGGITLFRLRHAELTGTFGPLVGDLLDKIEKPAS